MTPTEAILWGQLRNRKLYNLKFRRQVPLHDYIVDFFCREKMLVIEIDGGIHQFLEEEDRARQQVLEEAGSHVLRFTNEEVQANMPAVLEEIAKQANINQK